MVTKKRKKMTAAARRRHILSVVQKKRVKPGAMNATTNAINQPLPLQRRPELESREIVYRRQRYWSVKDPLSLRYFQLRDEEHFILSLLDGRTSLETIQQRFQERYAPRRIELPQLNWFLGMLHREGLVVSDAKEQGQQLIGPPVHHRASPRPDHAPPCIRPCWTTVEV